MLAVGAAETIVLGEIEADRVAQLPSLLPAILFSVLMPFLGPDQAVAEMRSAARKVSESGARVDQQALFAALHLQHEFGDRDVGQAFDRVGAQVEAGDGSWVNPSVKCTGAA